MCHVAGPQYRPSSPWQHVAAAPTAANAPVEGVRKGERERLGLNSQKVMPNAVAVAA